MIIIGITGTLGAGKGAISKYLKEHYGFQHYSVREFITIELAEKGLEATRDNMLEQANAWRREFGPAYIVDKLYEKAQTSNRNSVIESVRTLGEVYSLKSKSDFYLFAVDAAPTVRYERVVARKSTTDSVSFEKFLEDENKEMDSDDPAKQNLRLCIGAADYKFNNDGSLEELYAQVDLALAKLI